MSNICKRFSVHIKRQWYILFIVICIAKDFEFLVTGLRVGVQDNDSSFFTNSNLMLPKTSKVRSLVPPISSLTQESRQRQSASVAMAAPKLLN